MTVREGPSLYLRHPRLSLFNASTSIVMVMIGLIHGRSQRERAMVAELASELGLHQCPDCHQQWLDDNEDCPRCANNSETPDSLDLGI